MNIRKLAEGLYIAPQLTQADAADAAELGIRSVICNRPDGEADDQPAFNQVRQWLAEAGIANTVHQPVVAPAIGGQDTARFQALLNQAEKPVLAYCRTGTRSALLWAYHQVRFAGGGSRCRSQAGGRRFGQFRATFAGSRRKRPEASVRSESGRLKTLCAVISAIAVFGCFRRPRFCLSKTGKNRAAPMFGVARFFVAAAG